VRILRSRHRSLGASSSDLEVHRAKAADRKHTGLRGETPPRGALLFVNRSRDAQFTDKWYDPKLKTWKYRYTRRTVATNAASKFQRNHAFGKVLPQIRARYARDLKRDGKDRIIALILALVDQAYFRIGNQDSADHGAFGVTTLRRRHVKFEGRKAVFRFRGKQHVWQHGVVVDARIMRLLKALHRGCPSAETPLFRYAGKQITAQDVNAYLDRFGATAKNFRTYHATHIAYEMLRARDRPDLTKRERRLIIKDVVEEVAGLIGHEPATCRQSYIDRQVLTSFREGKIRDVAPL
jgi:DNA topoisomerase-1